jgi:hypothetical protein
MANRGALAVVVLATGCFAPLAEYQPDGGGRRDAGEVRRDSGVVVVDAGHGPFFEADDVLLWGSTWEGLGQYQALGRFRQPHSPLMAFPGGIGVTSGRLSSRGDFFYLVNTPNARALWRFAPDGLEWSATVGAWVPSARPEANDVRMPTPACDAVGGPDRFILQQNTEAYAYRCAGGWHASVDAGFVVPRDHLPLNWLESGQLLVQNFVSPSSFPMVRNLAVVQRSGTVTPVSGDWPATTSVFTTRAQGDVIWAAASLPDAGFADQLWAIDTAGKGTFVSHYPPAPLDAGRATPVGIDRNGSLFARGSNGTGLSETFFVQRDLSGDSAVIYDEAALPFSDFTLSQPYLVLRVHVSQIVTKP